jgi:hypothetical protein
MEGASAPHPPGPRRVGRGPSLAAPRGRAPVEMKGRMRPFRILTWHVHGAYLYYLSQTGHEISVPVRPGRPEGYVGRRGNFPFPDTLREVPADAVRRLDFDLVLFQARAHYERDRHELLSPAQQRLPRVYLEHDPPREHPTDARHWVDDPDTLLVHVTPFNALMWDSGRAPVRVVEHGVAVPAGVRYTGEIAKGIAVVNNLARRGRRLGADLFEAWRREVPLDLAGINSEEAGGLGDVPHYRLAAFEARYRFFLNPIRYTSLGLALCEAMMLGMPVVALATTEVATAIEPGLSGFVDTDPARLVGPMRELLADPGLARRIGREARRRALERFSIDRFVRDWNAVFAEATGRGAPAPAGACA